LTPSLGVGYQVTAREERAPIPPTDFTYRPQRFATPRKSEQFVRLELEIRYLLDQERRCNQK